jgi:hypothetical protein
MRRINYRRVVLGGLLAGVVFIVVEIILEQLVFKNIPGIGSEFERMQALDITMDGWGQGNRLLAWALPFLGAILLVWIYAAIRPRFGPGPRTAVLASFVILGFWVILLAYFTNLGLFPLKLSAVSFLDNVIILPTTALTGASVYRES